MDLISPGAGTGRLQRRCPWVIVLSSQLVADETFVVTGRLQAHTIVADVAELGCISMKKRNVVEYRKRNDSSSSLKGYGRCTPAQHGCGVVQRE